MKMYIPLVSVGSLLAALFAGGCASNQPSRETSASAVHRHDSLYPQIYDIRVGAPEFVDVTKMPVPVMTAPAVSPGAVAGAPVVPMASSGAPLAVESESGLATKELTVKPKEKLYYQVISAVPVKAIVYQRSTPESPRILINELEGTRIVSWVKPDYSELEFDFSPLKAGDSAQIKFIVSDRVLVR